MTNSDNLTDRQKQVIPFFVSNLNVDSACEKAAISRNCYYEWLKQPSFKAELDRYRNAILDNAIEHLKIISNKAIATLELLLDREDCPSVQRAAANDVLHHIAKFKELSELEARISRLEEKN